MPSKQSRLSRALPPNEQTPRMASCPTAATTPERPHSKRARHHATRRGPTNKLCLLCAERPDRRTRNSAELRDGSASLRRSLDGEIPEKVREGTEHTQEGEQGLGQWVPSHGRWMAFSYLLGAAIADYRVENWLNLFALRVSVCN
ncbi:hypothetical protein S7711_11450 [Stachybotrys chartarum IBT 7711]|uniref:Uncharacterized protein n=1 Tax=Stachybotrys chartarum (strain CBS 109288 / IBT 7711) TaxID=1280523 RepID=A0A084AEU5_STACB|nr:hypothetical protein S7711_11450 [Stachybotrys chartarum IBT 7711]KFA52613.1 hypothetical protein S40293_11161 [Stachybotrys chartarum IBT 40293]KFA76695.1 hypothetical protein S40288_10923 [Stachybotrys chartarum IBT 40288]